MVLILRGYYTVYETIMIDVQVGEVLFRICKTQIHVVPSIFSQQDEIIHVIRYGRSRYLLYLYIHGFLSQVDTFGINQLQIYN
jgi:hypothetical protein